MNWSHLLFSFEGRIGRAPYWYFVLAVTVLFAVLFAFAGVSLFSGVGLDGVPVSPPSAGIAGILLPLVCLALLWPSLAVAAKRWHDVDKSAWWILIGLVPVVGGLVALVFNGFVAGTPGANRFGDPSSGGRLTS
ncbi:DUF805 domain-containing protein [Dokdonella ginsengisoli]|uniref:DUF805 domain-containing protein n=1 Tax=Dokdonella ginsengisoli TaxID=363846 RepID=A0ABV9QTQ6_9GAMM